MSISLDGSEMLKIASYARDGCCHSHWQLKVQACIFSKTIYRKLILQVAGRDIVHASSQQYPDAGRSNLPSMSRDLH